MNNAVLVLRKGIGAYSAGTRVEVLKQTPAKGDTVTVNVLAGRIQQTHNLKNYIKGEIIEVPIDYLEQLRPRTR